jgi:NAD(P)-dependent dehydrogenase (short-subunit alcohol dehydrogenase family)
MDNLKGQIAVVTGASSGIGKAIALSLAGHGAELYLAARRKELLAAVAHEAEALGSRAHACPVDLTKDEDIRSLGERLQKDCGRVNILVLCGGAIAHGALEKASLADLDLMYRSNVRGQYALVQTFLPLLRKAPGQIVFINSSAGLRSPEPQPGKPRLRPYCLKLRSQTRTVFIFQSLFSEFWWGWGDSNSRQTV